VAKYAEFIRQLIAFLHVEADPAIPLFYKAPPSGDVILTN
jgi:hypothetical protein